MGALIAIVLRNVHPELEVLEPLEEGERAAAAEAGAAEIGGAGGIGRGFLGARKSEEAAHRRLLARGHDAHAGFAGAHRDRRRAEDQRQDHDPGRLLDALLDPDDVAAGDVAELVGDDALHLVGVLGGGEQAGMDVDDLPARDEGVDVALVKQDDSDILRLEPGGLDDRPRQLAQHGLGLGVAKDRLGRRGLKNGGKAERQKHQQVRRQAHRPACRAAARYQRSFSHGSRISAASC